MRSPIDRELDAILTRRALDRMAAEGAEDWLSSEIRLTVLDGELSSVSWMVTTERGDHQEPGELTEELRRLAEAFIREVSVRRSAPWDRVRFRLLSDGSYDSDFDF